MRVRILHVLIIAMLTLVVSDGVAAADPVGDGWAANERGDYVTALRLIKPLAAQGNAAAQDLYGFMYFYGHGVPQSDREAVVSPLF
jgi:uncharacterized protein